MTAVAIVDCVRTGITKAFSGSLRETRSDDMAAHCLQALLARNIGLDPGAIEDCVLGCAFPEGQQGLNLGRNVALLAGLGAGVPGVTVNRYCASGLEAVANAAAAIASDNLEIAVAGGVESASLTLKTINGTGLFNPRLERRAPGLYLGMASTEPTLEFRKRASRSMGETAELLAERYDVTRAEQDRWALRSQMLTARAQQDDLFASEIAPFEAVARRGGVDGPAIESREVTRDECNRPQTTLADLASLEPAFRPNGTVTAGNSCQVTDGAALCLLASPAAVRRADLRPIGLFLGYVVVGCAPELMGTGPVLAIPKLLRSRGLSLKNIDLFEINEAFAAQLVYCQRVLEIEEGRLNVNGGAISIGHPFGMTGARLLGHVLRELRRRRGRYGVVSMCIGGGMGAAALVESIW